MVRGVGHIRGIAARELGCHGVVVIKPRRVLEADGDGGIPLLEALDVILNGFDPIGPHHEVEVDGRRLSLCAPGKHCTAAGCVSGSASSKTPDRWYERSAASASSSSEPAKQLPGSISASRLRLVTSSRFRVRGARGTSLRSVLEVVTLADLANGELPTRVQALAQEYEADVRTYQA